MRPPLPDDLGWKRDARVREDGRTDREILEAIRRKERPIP
jgi:hypothetical protein